MATRGTAILITNNNLLVSTEFNGYMYPDDYGDEFFQGLSKVKNNKEFQRFLDNFNKKHFDYPEEMVYEYRHEELCSIEKDSTCKHIDLLKKHTVFPSDWLFFKNLSNEKVTIAAMKNNLPQKLEMLPGETFRFHFDEIPSDAIYQC